MLDGLNTPTQPRAWPAAPVAWDVIAATQATPQALARRQAERLVLLLESARRTRLYGPLLAGCELQSLRLAALPALRKAQLMQDLAAGLNDADITAEELRAFCTNPALVGQRFRGRYWVWESSGSTGQPGIFVQDEAAMAVYDALETHRRCAPRPWARWMDPWGITERFVFVGATGGHFASHVSLQRCRQALPWLTSQWHSCSIMQPMARLVAQLNALKPTIVATYPTAALLLAHEARQGRLQARPAEVWTGGETLTPGARRSIEAGLQCMLRNSYGASEFLPIAWECARGALHVNADWVILEPVDAQGRPVAGGQLSHTTLLTNLANHLQPLIRLDIGDRIRLHDTRCACGCALPVVEVQGRCDDVLQAPAADGRVLGMLPLALTGVLEDEAGVFDFQLQQTALDHWRLLLGPTVPAGRLTTQRCVRALAHFARAQGAEGLTISVQRVAQVPVQRAGKTQRVLSACKLWPLGAPRPGRR